MAKRDRAEYMRRYRSKRPDEPSIPDSPPPRDLDDRPWSSGIGRMTQKERDEILRRLNGHPTPPTR